MPKPKYSFQLVILFFLFPTLLFSQIREAAISNFKSDISILASDSFMGREAGTEGEIMARDYIASTFKSIGLKPFFGDSYYKDFPFKDGADFSGSSLTINEKKMLSLADFQPLSNSKNGHITGNMLKVGFGIMSQSPAHNDYTNHAILDGKIFIMEVSVPGGNAAYEQFSDVADLDKRINLAVKFGAKAIILINNDSTFNDPRKMISNSNGRTPIPVIFAKGEVAKLINSLDSGLIDLNVEIKKFDKTGYNVAGFLDRGSSKTIIIGAHYDHLGFGGETSRYQGKAIHNGADDNASGVALVLELARHFSQSDQGVNFLFVTFSAEEKGLYGSNYFVANSLSAVKGKVTTYLNFDMVGRLNNQNPVLTLIGTGTANQWNAIIDSIVHPDFQLVKSPSGIGGSDQMPFYLDSIPVLFFFSGIHDDYHKPTDDEPLINYNGMKDIGDFAVSLIESISKTENLAWQQTKDSGRSSSRGKGGPSMGIMPDYSADGGVLVNMVIEGKPAFKAGVLLGDIIKAIDEKPINDVYDYMEVMKTLKTGQAYQLQVKRAGEIKTLNITF